MTEAAMKVVIVGFGGMGTEHYKRLKEVDVLDVVGAYDISEVRQDAAMAYGLKAYPSFEAVLGDPQVDFVLIATPNDLHKVQAIAALKAGKNVICEKPAMLDSAELAEVIATAADCERLFMVHQNRRWDDDYLTMKKLYDNDTLGRVHYIETRVHGARGIPGDWRKEAARGGGMLLDWGVHLIDRLLLMVDSPVVRVYGHLSYALGADCDDGVKAYLTFANGTHALVDVGTANFIGLPIWYVAGLDGAATVEDWEHHGKVVRLLHGRTTHATPIRAGAGVTKTMAPRIDDSISTLPLDVVVGDVTEFYRNAVAVVRGEAEPIVTNAQVLRVMRLLEAIKHSADTGECVAFETE